MSAEGFPPAMVGTWAWGDRPYWGYGTSLFGPSQVVDTFQAAMDGGLSVFDTAEVYGEGESEKIVGWLTQRRGEAARVATKFGLLAGRGGARALRGALAQSLRRLRTAKVWLYQIHWPDRTQATIDELMAALAEAVQEGRCERVGVSNFSADEMLRAHEALVRRGLGLASNQVRYSLAHRAPERDGVLAACRQTGATLLAYSPLEQGLLAGRYHEGPLPAGRRGGEPWFGTESRARTRPLVEALGRVGERHGRSAAQVAVRWLMEQPGVVPIVGLTSAAQARQAAALGAFSLTDDERAELSALAAG